MTAFPTLFLRLCVLISGLMVLHGCVEQPNDVSRGGILVVGDSLMAWNGGSSRAVSDVMEHQMQREVVDRSVSAARMIYNLPVSGAAGLSIPKQVREGDWDWVVVNGGGNDLWLGCGCFACKRKMDRLVSEDGSTGAIPKLVTRLRAMGAKVIYTGYLRSPGRGSPIEHCKDEGQELDRRAARMAAQDEGVYFLSLADLVPHGDRSYHAFDMIHPSVKGSDAIASRITALMRAEAATGRAAGGQQQTE